MMLRSKSLLCSLALFMIQFAWASAGGWPQPKGGYFIRLSEWWIVSDQHFDSEGNIRPNILDYGYYATSVFAEVGIGDRWTAILSFPFINYTYTQQPSLTKQSIWKTGDADMGLRYALTYQKPIAIGITLSVALPFGYNENEALLTGYNSFSEMLRIDVSHSLNANSWINIYSGYNQRHQGYAAGFHYGIEGGLTSPNKKLTFIARLTGVEALGDDEAADHVNPQSLFSNFKEYLSISPEVIYHVDEGWGVTLGGGFAVAGKNIFANPSFTVGVFNRFQKIKEIPANKPASQE